MKYVVHSKCKSIRVKYFIRVRTKFIVININSAAESSIKTVEDPGIGPNPGKV
jgi:hypothetical protein